VCLGFCEEGAQERGLGFVGLYLPCVILSCTVITTSECYFFCQNLAKFGFLSVHKLQMMCWRHARLADEFS